MIKLLLLLTLFIAVALLWIRGARGDPAVCHKCLLLWFSYSRKKYIQGSPRNKYHFLFIYLFIELWEEKQHSNGKNILFCIKQKFWGSRNVLLPFISTNSKPQIPIFHATNDLTLGLFFLACPWTVCSPLTLLARRGPGRPSGTRPVCCLTMDCRNYLLTHYNRLRGSGQAPLKKSPPTHQQVSSRYNCLRFPMRKFSMTDFSTTLGKCLAPWWQETEDHTNSHTAWPRAYPTQHPLSKTGLT